MSIKQGFPAWELLELGRGARDNAPRARVRNLETGELLSVDPQLCLELGLPAEESYHCGHARGWYEGEQSAWLRSQVMRGSQLLLDELPLTVALLEPEGTIELLSAPVVPGVTVDRTVKSNVCDWLPSRRHNQVLANYQECLRTGVWMTETERIITELGEFELRAWCTRSNSGKIIVLSERQPRLIQAAA